MLNVSGHVQNKHLCRPRPPTKCCSSYKDHKYHKSKNLKSSYQNWGLGYTEMYIEKTVGKN